MDNRPHLWLVDDDPEMGVIVGLHCRRGGLSLTCFGDVASAWQAWEGEAPRPALVLLDVNLPGESGLALLRRWRKAGPTPAVALFCQPGLARDIAAGWAEGADYLVSKGLVADPDGWSRRVGEIISRADGDSPPLTLEWLAEERGDKAVSWGRILSRATEQPELRALGGAVLTQVVRRCLVLGFGPAASACLHPVSGRVSALALARPATPGQARAVLRSLVDQVDRLLGRAAALGCEQRLLAAWIAPPTSHVARH